MSEVCQFCCQPAKYVAKRLCGAHDQQMRRSVLSVEEFTKALAAGESPGRKLKPCSECGTVCAGHSLTCSDLCATVKRRRQQRESKRREWVKDSDKLKKRQRELRKKNPEIYKAIDRKKLERKQKQNPTFCQECGAETTGTNTGRKFCCVACREIAYGRKRRMVHDDQSLMTALALSNVQPVDLSTGGRRKRYVQICLHCGVEFKSVTGCAKYCSKLCRDSLTEDKAPAHYDCNCDVCSVPFRSKRLNAKYCSLECHRKRRAEEKRKPAVVRVATCQIYNQQFAADRKTAKTCSIECRAEAKRRMAAESGLSEEYRERQKLLARIRNNVAPKCTVCGVDMASFTDLRVNRYTCSDQCRKLALQEKNRRTYENRRNRNC